MSTPLPPEPSTRAWWTAWLVAWLVLLVLQALQTILSSAALGGTTFGIVGFLRIRAVEILLQLLLATAALLFARALAPPEEDGAGIHLVVCLVALAPVPFLAAIIERPLHDVLHGVVIFRGSQAAKSLGDYVTLAGATAAAEVFELTRSLRERERHAATLEAHLADARLDALAAQLHPHFLFNTLNAIAVLVHRAPDEADAMLTRLAELLRATLSRERAHEIPLDEELALLARYVEIMRIRYGPRLRVETRVDDGARALLVPAFVLQPLVENALEHGIGRRSGPGVVAIAATVEGDALRLTVTDDGPGIDAGVERDGSRGVGLANTRRRLDALYGPEGRLTLERMPGEGTRAMVELPARVAGHVLPASA